jgi:hypothetical protein
MLICLTFFVMRRILRSTNQNYTMKNFISLMSRFCLVLILFCIATAMGAQTPENPFQPGTTVEQVFTWYNGVYAAALMILTRLQAVFFPNAGNVPRVAVRYILIAAVVGILFVTLGFTNAWGLVIGFVGAALAYDKIVDPLSAIPGLGWLKTPKPV